MASTSRAYNAFNYGLLRGRFNTTSDTYKIALLTSAYQPVSTGIVRQEGFIYQPNDVVYNSTWGVYFTAVTGGTSAVGTPVFTNVLGATVNDGTVVWRCDGQTPPSDHDAWADVSAYEVSDGTYPAGGVTLTSVSASQVDGFAVFSAAEAAILVSNVTAKYGVIYKDATVDGVTKPLVSYFSVSADGTVQTVTSGYFRVTTGTYGFFRVQA